MSRHRYPCAAEPPADLVAADIVEAEVLRHAGWPAATHRHRCIRDREPSSGGEILEHKCDCGMTWQATSLRPAPPDKAWIQMEAASAGPGIWPLIAVLAIVALLVAAVLEVLKVLP